MDTEATRAVPAATGERRRSWRDDLAARHEITQARLRVMFELEGESEEYL